MYDYDIIIVSDFRFPGGTSSCIAEELLALNRAGYRTGMIQINSPVFRKSNRFINDLIIERTQPGLIDFIQPIKKQLSTKLLLLHHPNVFTEHINLYHDITAENLLLIVHQPPVDNKETYYEINVVNQSILSSFGQLALWAPVGPKIRDSLLQENLDKKLILNEDWVNLIDVDLWHHKRQSWLSDIPIIGRHSRPSPMKWPDTKEDVEHIYPVDGSMKIRVLGGCPIIPNILPEQPFSWEVLEFGAVHPKEFLKTIDFFVYFHSPKWVEAFGRTILEAVCSGAIAILPDHFERVFGKSAVYCQPHDVQDKIWELYRNPELAQQQRIAAETFIRENYGLEKHIKRVKEIIGEPTINTLEIKEASTSNRNVVFFSTNGSGIGHLTRVMAVAKRLSNNVQPVIVTTSKAIRWVAQEGFFVEHIPDTREMMAEKNGWNDFLYRRLFDILTFYEAKAFVFDGNFPYQGVVDVISDLEHLRSFWIRRGMWKEDSGGSAEKALARQKFFDFVIQPTDFAQSKDKGMQPNQSGILKEVAPIVYLNSEELIEAEQAKKELDLDLNKKSVFVQLGSGNYVDVTPSYKCAIEHLKSYSDVEIVLGKSPITRDNFADQENVVIIEAYPISKYFKAFDFLISATGYNTFHECMTFGVPAIFIPVVGALTPDTLEDTTPRAVFAESLGLCLHVTLNDEIALKSAIDAMLTGGAQKIRQKFRETERFGKGAIEAAHYIEESI
jgi:UDP:flavonoid glycosyltransferase YjiC (YdhE family)